MIKQKNKMRKIQLVFISLCLIFGSITSQVKKTTKPIQITKEQKVKQLMYKYMSENLGDYKSYEPISFSQLDTLRQPINEDVVYNKLKKEKNEIIDKFLESANLVIGIYSKENNNVKLKDYSQLEILISMLESGRIDNLEVLKILKEYRTRNVTPKIKELEIYESNYIGKPIGFKFTHKYRAKNKFGGIEINDYVYSCDFSITTIVQLKENTI